MQLVAKLSVTLLGAYSAMSEAASVHDNVKAYLTTQK